MAERSRLLLRRAGRKPSIILFDHLAIAIGCVAVSESSSSVIAELGLEPSREFDFNLAQWIYHFTLQRRQLRWVGEGIRVDAFQFFYRAIEVASEIIVTSKRAFKLFGIGDPLTKLAFKLATSWSRWSSAH